MAGVHSWAEGVLQKLGVNPQPAASPKAETSL